MSEAQLDGCIGGPSLEKEAYGHKLNTRNCTRKRISIKVYSRWSPASTVPPAHHRRSSRVSVGYLDPEPVEFVEEVRINDKRALHPSTFTRK